MGKEKLSFQDEVELHESPKDPPEGDAEVVQQVDGTTEQVADEVDDLYATVVEEGYFARESVEEAEKIDPKVFEIIFSQPRVNDIYEVKQEMSRLAKEQNVSPKEFAKQFQQYLNTQASEIAQKIQGELPEKLAGEMTEELFFKTNFNKTQLPLISGGSMKMIEDDGDFGGGSHQLLDNIRVCRYMEIHNGSQIEQRFEKIQETFYDDFVILTLGHAKSVDELRTFLARVGIDDNTKEMSRFCSYLQSTANQLGVDTGRYMAYHSLGEDEVELLQKIRAAYTILIADRYQDYYKQSIRNGRKAESYYDKRYMPEDPDAYIDGDAHQWDLFEKRLKGIKFGKQDLMNIYNRIRRGEIPNVSQETQDKVWDHIVKLEINSAMTVLLDDPGMKGWLRARYSTYCIRSMRENFQETGTFIANAQDANGNWRLADYPAGLEFDPKRRREIIETSMLSQNADDQMSYFASRPEYFKSYSIKNLPEEKLDGFCNFVEAYIYTLAGKYPGVSFPILRDRTPLCHGSFGFIQRDEKEGLRSWLKVSVQAADSYYMEDGWSGSIRDLIRKIWERLQEPGNNAPEGVICLPRFIFAKGEELVAVGGSGDGSGETPRP